MIAIDVIDNTCLLRRANIVARAHADLVRRGIPPEESQVSTYSTVADWVNSVSGGASGAKRIVFLHRELGWRECIERCADFVGIQEGHVRVVTYTGSSSSTSLEANGVTSDSVKWWNHFHSVKSVRDFEGSNIERTEVAATVGRLSPPVEELIQVTINGEPFVPAADSAEATQEALADLEHNLINGVGPLRYAALVAIGRQLASIDSFGTLWRDLQQRLEACKADLPDWLKGWLIDRSQQWTDDSAGPAVGGEVFHELLNDLDRILGYARTLAPLRTDPAKIQELIRSLPAQDRAWKLLWIEDEESWSHALGGFFQACGFDVHFEVDPCKRLASDAHLDELADFDAVLLDMTLNGMGAGIATLLEEKKIPTETIADENAGVGVLRIIRTIPNTPPVFLFTAREDADIIKACTQLGAAGYCVKGRTEYYAFLTQLLAELRHRRQQLDEIERPKNPKLIVGDSMDPLLSILGKLDRAARTKGPIFLWGQAGVGKNELVVEIHARSGRKGDLQVFRCGDFAEMDSGMVSSAIFGHVAGAHNTATEQVEGVLWFADKGTLFIDEFDKLDATNRNKFLAFLNDRTYFRTGDQHEAVSVDVLVVLASNESESAFSAPLRRRIAKFPFEVPRLSDRSSVVPKLAQGLCDRICIENGWSTKQLSDESKDHLQKRAKTGGFDETNVGGLLNLIEQAVVYTDESRIEVQDIRNLDELATRLASKDDTIIEVGRILAEYVESQTSVNLQELEGLVRGAMFDALHVALTKDEARMIFGQNHGAFRKRLNDMKGKGLIDFGAEDWK